MSSFAMLLTRGAFLDFKNKIRLRTRDARNIAGEKLNKKSHMFTIASFTLQPRPAALHAREMYNDTDNTIHGRGSAYEEGGNSTEEEWAARPGVW